MIDVNVNLSRWPFRRLPADEPAALVASLKKHGVTEAWAGSFDGILHKDIAAVNSRLAADCDRYRGFLRPFGSVNPMLPGWQDDLRRIQEVHQMPGIRLHPNYHGYSLKDPIAGELFAAAAQRGLVVQLALSMEDERTQHWLVRAPAVDPAPLNALLPKVPKLKLMLLNASHAAPQVRGAYCDFAMLESPYAVKKLAAAVGDDYVVFGSNAPLFYFSSAALKLKEAGLSDRQAKAFSEGNARRLCG